MVNNFKNKEEVTSLINTILKKESRKNVVMFVGNSISNDSRVLKSANSLIDNGFNVLLIGLKSFINLKENDFNKEYYELNINKLSCILVDFSEFKSKLKASEDEHFELTKIVSNRINKLLNNVKFDFLYTHDFWGLDYGTQILNEQYLQQKIIWVHDIHEYTNGLTEVFSEGRFSYAKKLENMYIHIPDKLIIVNERISEILEEEYEIKNMSILHNSPIPQVESDMDIKEYLNISDDDILGVYLGKATELRGLNIIIPCLKALPNLHFVIFAFSLKAYLDELKNTAKINGVNERLHIVDYVSHEKICNTIKSCDFGFSPLKKYGNTNLAIPSKVLEYLHSEIPVIASNLDFQKDFILSNDLGVVFEIDNEEDCIEKIKNIKSFSELKKDYTAVKSLYSWDKQFNSIIEFMNDSLISGIKQRGIFQGVGPSAGQPHAIAKALRKNGLTALSLSVAFENKFNISSDAIWPVSNLNSYFSLTYWIADRFEIIHLHFRPIILNAKNQKYVFPSFSDLALFKQLGKKVIFTYRGSEIRKYSIFSKKNRYAWRKEEDPMFMKRDESSMNYLEKVIHDMVDLVLVTDFELKTYVKESKILPRIIDVSKYKNIGLVNSEKLKIIHAPSRRGVKGSEIVLDVVHRLKERGLSFDFELIENLPHSEMKNKIEEADIIIDQLKIGWYGVLSVEAMALGKVTLAYIRDDLVNTIEDLPIINVNIDTLEKELLLLLNDKELRKEIAYNSRKFAEKYHSEESVVKLLKEYYSIESKRDYSREFNNSLIRIHNEKYEYASKYYSLRNSWYMKIINEIKKIIKRINNIVIRLKSKITNFSKLPIKLFSKILLKISFYLRKN